MFPSELGHWYGVRDGNPIALALYERHYSCYRFADGRERRRLVGPGERIVLLTSDGLSLFVWRKCQYLIAGEQSGVNCAVFRNEGPLLSSDLIREAEVIAWRRWPGERLFTYVNPRAIKSSNPGYCFKVAGWRVCGMSKKRGYVILEKWPELGAGHDLRREQAK